MAIITSAVVVHIKTGWTYSFRSLFIIILLQEFRK